MEPVRPEAEGFVLDMLEARTFRKRRAKGGDRLARPGGGGPPSCAGFAFPRATPGVPGLDIPGLDLASIARGYGCEVARLNELEAIKQAAAKALAKDVPTVLEVAISPQLPPLS